MERLWSYLEDEPAGIRAARYFLVWLFIFELYLYFAILRDFRLAGMAFMSWGKILSRIFSAAGEEMIFRAAPFDLAYTFFGGEKKKFRIGVLFCWLVFSFALFGPLHVFFSLYRVTFFFSIVAQGVLGLILAKIYLKCGGIRGKMIKPLIICTFVHWAHNIYTGSALYIKIS